MLVSLRPQSPDPSGVRALASGKHNRLVALGVTGLDTAHNQI